MNDQVQLPRAAHPVPAGEPVHRSSIGCVIPANDDERSIARVIESLLGQTRVPDIIHVVVYNTSDATVQIASRYAGPHEITTDLGAQYTEVFVHDVGGSHDEKVGALNYGYALVEGCDFLLSVDDEAIADPRAVEYLEWDAVCDARISAMTAISWVDGTVIIFSTQALREAMEHDHRAAPWVHVGSPVVVQHFDPSAGGHESDANPKRIGTGEHR